MLQEAAAVASIGSSLFGKGGKKNSGSSVQVTRTEPATYLEPYLKDTAAKAQEAYQDFIAKGYNLPFAGDRTAGPNAYDANADGSTLSAINSFSGVPGQTFGAANRINDNVNSGRYTDASRMAFNAEGNRYTADAIQAGLTPILQQWQEKTLPGLKSAAISGGAYGGSKQQEFDSQAYRDTQQQVADLTAKIQYDDFSKIRDYKYNDLNARRALLQSGLNTELNAAGQASNLNNAGLAQALQPAQLYQTLADKERGFTQADIDAEMQKYAEQQQSPFAGLDFYSSLINGQAGLFKNTTSTSQGPKTSNFLNGLSGLQNLLSMGGREAGTATYGPNQPAVGNYGSQISDWLSGLFN